MRRIWVAIALLLFITVICVSGLITLNSRTNEMISMLDELSTSMEQLDHAELMEKAEKIKAQWEQWQGWYNIHLQHSLVEQVTQTINRIPPLIEENNLIECQDECIDAILLLHIILKSEQLSLGNIL